MAIKTDFSKLIGKRFGRLEIISESKPHITSGGNHHRTALCKCDCGNTNTIQIGSILNGRVKSCGCLSKETASRNASIRNKKHGLYKSLEYNIWCSMKKRCLNPTHKSYHYYGGRGITVCDEWKNDFDKFISDMGNRPIGNYSIDRIDYNGNYERSNCRWATKAEQSRNQRNNVLVTHKGETKCVGEWAIQFGISYSALHYRLFISKWDIDSAFNTPLSHGNKYTH